MSGQSSSSSIEVPASEKERSQQAEGKKGPNDHAKIGGALKMSFDHDREFGIQGGVVAEGGQLILKSEEIEINMDRSVKEVRG